MDHIEHANGNEVRSICGTGHLNNNVALCHFCSEMMNKTENSKNAVLTSKILGAYRLKKQEPAGC